MLDKGQLQIKSCSGFFLSPVTTLSLQLEATVEIVFPPPRASKWLDNCYIALTKCNFRPTCDLEAFDESLFG